MTTMKKGPDVVRTIVDIFIEAFSNPEECIQQAAVESLIVYLEKILMDSDQNLGKYTATLDHCFSAMLDLPENRFFLVVRNPHQLKKIGQAILDKMPEQLDISVFNRLLFRFFTATYEYWLKEEDPSVCLKEFIHFSRSSQKTEGT